MALDASGAILGVGKLKENLVNLTGLFQRLPRGGLDLVFFAASAASLVRDFRGG